MAKKKLRKTQDVLGPETSFAESITESTPCSKSTSQRPKTSPYISSPVALRIGPEQREYYVPRDLLQNPDWIASSSTWRGAIHLADVDENTGHVLVHYLYTGAYQTLDNTEPSSVDEVKIEFKRAVLAYVVANKYSINGLQRLAKNKIKNFGTEMGIFDIAEVIKDDFSKLLGSTAWFHDYLDEKAKSAFEEDRTVFARDDFFGRINDVGLARVLAKFVIELYNDKVERMLDAEKVPAVRTSEECRPDVPDAPVDKGLVEGVFTIEAISKEDHPYPAPECPTDNCPAPECPVEAYPTDDCPAPECPVEDYPTDDCLAPERPAEDYPADDCPTLECPAEDYPTDDCPALECTAKDYHVQETSTNESLMTEELEPILKDVPGPGPAVEEGGLWRCGSWSLKATEEVDELVRNGHSDVEADPEQPASAEGEICPLRVNHLFDGDKWKYCRKCRAMLHQVAIQLARAAHTDEDGYEIVDQLLVN